MPEPDVAGADRWMREHHGVITRDVLRRLGFSERAAHRFVTSQRLVTIARGVYVSPAHPPTPHQLMAAACLAHPAVAVTSTTAAREWGFRGMADRIVRVIAPHDVRIEPVPGVRLQRTRRLDPVDLAGRRRDGIRLTSPPRSLLEAAAVVGPEATESAVEQALAEGKVKLSTLMATARRLHHPRRPGASIFLEVLESRPAWRGAARSDLEVRLRRAIERRGLPQPEVNHPLLLSNGEPIEIDLAWVDVLVAVEVDHPAWHDGAAASRSDKRRDRLLAGMGWLPQRVTEEDIESHLDETLDQLEAVLVQRGWRRAGAA